MAWELDKSHSTIGFAVKHMMVTTVRGRFRDFTGKLDLSEQNPTASTVDVTIQTASIDTGDEKRDAHLTSPDFFDAAQYPTITFKSTKIEESKKDHFQVTGDLTIHGVTKSITLEGDLEGFGKNPYGLRIASISLKGDISRKDFGLNWNVALESGGWLVSDKVILDIEAQVFQPAEQTAGANA